MEAIVNNDNTLINVLETEINSLFDEYYDRSGDFFGYLKQRRGKLTADEFKVYRDNFFYRTATTVESVAKVVIAAQRNHDIDTLQMAGQNLYEETGSGGKFKPHPLLLEESHNLHGMRIFDLTPTYLNEIDDSECIIKQAIEFRKAQDQLYSHKSYLVVLGASYAQETAAIYMLTQLYHCVFIPYQNIYNKGEFDLIAEYFLCHINGLEQRHSEYAKKSLLKFCKNNNDFDNIVLGINTFLKIQASLWVGLFQRMSSS